MQNSAEQIRSLVFDALRASLDRPVELSDDTNITEGLGLDSVAVMDFVMEIEDALDISIPLDRIAEVKTVGDLIAAAQDLKGGR
ncbi:acyl carrier protein [Nitrospirillum sp. BR 11163]|uniref:acyl carrier protein n=1 Tax=Nitrospirillum sp. BR 11163 TaxID=3104323 RepID=UPI002AFEABD9|nr:acyl carrier protein [Nitrospirillum sp. BR 11163]MEA1671945.1 acyl carrier protein [Nitrospirillum sp. BR 11163]